MLSVGKQVMKRPSAPVTTPALLGALLLSACAHGRIILGTNVPPPAASSSKKSDRPRPRTGAPPAADLAGTWDWLLRTRDEGGNLRVEQEEWHLTQKGADLDGWYDRAVTILSQDERLFRCNQQLGYTRFTRVRVGGVVEGTHVSLRELDYRTRPGPCDDGARVLLAYEGEIEGGAIKLLFPERAGQQTLRRREGEGQALAQVMGFDEKTAALPSAARTAGPVSGVWEWELKSVDAEGDERTEREEWHLDEEDDDITGWYERRVVRRRGDGVFPCNGGRELETSTRYEIRGHRFGDSVTLTETSFRADKDRCDNGQRRLDVYQGTISGRGGAESGVLVLTWGSGNQVLHRRAEGPGAP